MFLEKAAGRFGLRLSERELQERSDRGKSGWGGEEKIPALENQRKVTAFVYLK